MGEYTTGMQAAADEFVFNDDNEDNESDFTKDGIAVKLIKIAKRFRTQSAALTAVLCTHGYEGKPEDVEAKVSFLKSKCRVAGVESPRDMRKWFTEGKMFERETILPLCFALGLDLEGTNDLCKKAYFERGLDYHSVKDLVYAYCLRSGRTYAEAEALFTSMSKVKANQKVDLTSTNILYTDEIKDALDEIENDEDLRAYVQEHAEQFCYNSVSCMQKIRELWEKIAGENGLAYQEWCLQSFMLNGQVKPPKAKANSTWTILSFILRLDNNTAKQRGATRSINKFFEENPLVPELIRKVFPARNTIEKILRGEHMSDETLRKWLILLEFYSFWASLIVERQEIEDISSDDDVVRFMDAMNNTLLEVGFFPLYIGNPYDWIFLWCIKDKPPLDAFRDYIEELRVYGAK